jgi:hypothetical protein
MMMKRLLLALSALGLAALACGTPSVNTDPTTQPPVPNRKVLYQDNFSDANSGWPSASDADKSASYSADGQYLLTVMAAQQDVWAHPGQNFTDVSVEVDAVKTGGPDNNSFGLVCRFVDNDNFYYFLVSSDGYQVIGKYEAGESKFISSEQMQPSSAITSGSSTNHLRADCDGSTLTLYANGQQIATVTDSSFTSGDVGVIVGTFEEGNVSISFDNFVVYEP